MLIFGFRFQSVALFTRAWIEILTKYIIAGFAAVALFTRAWIEIEDVSIQILNEKCRPLHEGVD